MQPLRWQILEKIFGASNSRLMFNCHVKYGIQIQNDWERIELAEERCDQILSLVGSMNNSLSFFCQKIYLWQTWMLLQVKGIITSGQGITNTTSEVLVVDLNLQQVFHSSFQENKCQAISAKYSITFEYSSYLEKDSKTIQCPEKAAFEYLVHTNHYTNHALAKLLEVTFLLPVFVFHRSSRCRAISYAECW